MRVALVVASLAIAAAAADEALNKEVERYVESPSLPEVLVTAKSEPLFEVPLTASSGRSTLGPEVLQQAGKTTIADALQVVPGLRMYDESGTDSKPNFGVRGLDPNRSIYVASLVDGIPIAPAPYGHPGMSLFPFTLERAWAIDIFRGGYTVPFGPNTIGGVINFLTRPIPEKPSIEIRERLAGHGDSSTYVVAGGTAKQVGALVEAVYKTGDTHRENGEYTIQNYGGKFAWSILENLTLLAQIDYYEDDSRLAGGLSLANFQADPYQCDNDEDYFKGHQARGNIRLKWAIEKEQELELLVYAYQGNRAFYLGRPVHYGDTPTSIQATPRPSVTWAYQPQYRGTFDFLGARHDLLAGIRLHRETIDIDQYTETWPTPGTVAYSIRQHFNYLVWSFFVQDAIHIGERLMVMPGIRYENIDIGADDELTSISVERDMTQFLPALSASYLIGDSWSLFANAQSSFRAPAYNYIEISTKPQSLEVERAETYEVGVRVDSRRKDVRGSITLFLMNFHDKLERDPDEDNVYNNIGEARHKGIEMEGSWHLGKVWESLEGLSLNGSFSLIDTEVLSGTYEGNELRHAPRHQLYLSCRYAHSSGLWAAIDTLNVGDSFSDEANTEASSANGNVGLNPEYWIWNLRAGYVRDLPREFGTIGIEVGVTNLFDTDNNYVHREGKGIQKGPDRVLYAVLGYSKKF